MKKIVIIGASGFATEVAWLIEEINAYKLEWEILGFVDDNFQKLPEYINGYKVLGDTNYINQLSDEVFLIVGIGNGKIREKISFKDDIENGRTILYYENGNVVMSVNPQTGETVVYHENGNPLMAIAGGSAAIFNENNEMLFKIENEQPVEMEATLNQLEDGSYELVKDDKVIAKIDANGQIGTYLYSTGEPLMRFDSSTGLSEIFFKDGTTLFESDGNNFTLNYKDGKPLYEAKGNVWKFFSTDGEEIISNFEIITDIKKVD